MTRQDVWLLTYISVVAMRHHPKNDGEDACVSAGIACVAADEAVKDFDTNFVDPHEDSLFAPAQSGLPLPT